MFVRILIICILFSFNYISQAKTQVNVALTSIQPPLVIDNAKRHGVIFDVIDALNIQQQDFEFKTKLYPAKRIMANFKHYDVHLIAFNNVNWGWKERGGISSINLTDGKDLFFSLKDTEFHSVHDESSIGAVDGFHYAFAEFDAKRLSQMANVILAHDEDGVLKLVEYHRVRKGVVSAAYLGWISKSRPEMFAKLDIDYDNPDHTYNRQFVVFNFSPIQVKELNKLLTNLYNNGTLKAIYSKYGMTLPTAEVFLDKS